MTLNIKGFLTVFVGALTLPQCGKSVHLSDPNDTTPLPQSGDPSTNLPAVEFPNTLASNVLKTYETQAQARLAAAAGVVLHSTPQPLSGPLENPWAELLLPDWNQKKKLLKSLGETLLQENCQKTLSDTKVSAAQSLLLTARLLEWARPTARDEAIPPTPQRAVFSQSQKGNIQITRSAGGDPSRGVWWDFQFRSVGPTAGEISLNPLSWRLFLDLKNDQVTWIQNGSWKRQADATWNRTNTQGAWNGALRLFTLSGVGGVVESADALPFVFDLKRLLFISPTPETALSLDNGWRAQFASEAPVRTEQQIHYDTRNNACTRYLSPLED